MTTVKVFAPAKINLTLHVTGQRSDGYHLLDSLVVFADVGDWLTFDGISTITDRPMPARITVSGSESAGVPTDQSNLIAQALAAVINDVAPEVRLEKSLPSSSGIGGGSADAAATLRAITSAWSTKQSSDPAPNWQQALASPVTLSRTPAYLSPYIQNVAKTLGADVPMCLDCRPSRVAGIGDVINPVGLPKLHAVLVNPRVPVSTPVVFKELINKNNAPMLELPNHRDAPDLINWLKSQRNDLQEPAISIAPEIDEVLSILGSDENCHLARMSGSGATCFGLYSDAESAAQAANTIKNSRKNWWVQATVFGDMTDLSKPISVS